MWKTILVGSLLLGSASAIPQTGEFSLAHLQPYTATFDYFLVREDGSLKKAGSWTDSVEIENDRILRTVAKTSLEGMTDLVRTVAADRTTLAPLHLTQRFGPDLSGFYHSQVQGDRLTQVFVSDHRSPARIASASIPAEVLEVNLLGLFAAALPLDEQRHISVNTYSAGAEPSGDTQIFEVLGPETVTLDGRELQAWKVHQPETDWTYWVSKEPPYLLKVSHPSPDGLLVSHLREFQESRQVRLSAQ